eukprot:scaffold1137_cov392-Pavlova_lutheri.AAC.5
MDYTEIRTVAIPRAIREEGGSSLSSFTYPLHGSVHPYSQQPSCLPKSKHRPLASDATPLHVHYKVTSYWRRTDTKTTSLLPSALSKRVHGAERIIASHTLAERVSHLEYFSDHAIPLPHENGVHPTLHLLGLHAKLNISTRVRRLRTGRRRSRRATSSTLAK